jgi:putative endonuclease
MWFVYLVECSDGTLYCGISNDVDKRIDKHNTKKGAKYTSTRTPVRLVYKEKADDRSSASKREYVIKKLSRDKKLLLIKSFNLAE